MLPSHPLPEVPFGCGYLGVDVFFVLSGFILASLYARLGPSTAGSFFLRRIARIMPLHAAVMVFLGIGALLAVALGHALTAYYAPRLFLPVFLLVQVPAGLSGWNDPAWSISVEMICYLSLPFVLPLARRVDRAWCLPIVAALLACDAILVALAGPQGVYVAVPKLWGWFPIARGFLGFYAGCFAARLVALDVLDRSVAWKPLGWRPIVFVGEISFSLYLVHQPILAIAKRLDPILARHGAAPLILPLFAGVVLALSLLTYRCIEQPGRRLPEIVGRRLAAWPRPAFDTAKAG